MSHGLADSPVPGTSALTVWLLASSKGTLAWATGIGVSALPPLSATVATKVHRPPWSRMTVQ
ncbi:hypothetical protein D3C83_115190 [compost metagenome]